MTCAIVLYFDRPFSEVDDEIGLTRAADVRMASSNPHDDIVVLVTQGYDTIPQPSVRRLARLRYKLINAEPILESIRKSYDFARQPRIWRDQPFHEACFLRWLVLEEFFGDSPVLAMDSDIVWRTDPFSLYEEWKKGGSFLCFKSCCLAFIKDRSFYEIYKSALSRLASTPEFGSEFSRGHFTGIYHDQALFQYLIQRGELPNDTANFMGHGFAERFYFSPNPLGIAPKKGEPPFSFEQKGAAEYINGQIVPFWHMQSSFSRYLFLARFLPAFTGRTNIRVPYERPRQDGFDPLLVVLNNFHSFLSKGQITLHNNRHKRLYALTKRARLYEEFFNRNLAREVFRNETWWAPGVWQSVPQPDRPAVELPQAGAA